jgi:hypothetical protein
LGRQGAHRASDLIKGSTAMLAFTVLTLDDTNSTASSSPSEAGASSGGVAAAAVGGGAAFAGRAGAGVNVDDLAGGSNAMAVGTTAPAPTEPAQPIRSRPSRNSHSKPLGDGGDRKRERKGAAALVDRVGMMIGHLSAAATEQSNSAHVQRIGARKQVKGRRRREKPMATVPLRRFSIRQFDNRYVPIRRAALT